MTKIKILKKTLIGLGVISGAIILGSGYQYVDYKFISKGHVEERKPFTAEKADISISFIRVVDAFDNYEKFNEVSYSDKDVNDVSKDLLSGKDGKEITTNYGNFNYFSRGDDNTFKGTDSFDVGQVGYQFQSHYEHDNFSTRVTLKKILDNNKSETIASDSFLLNYSIPYTDKTTIIKLPWDLASGSFYVIVFKIKRI